MGKIASLLLCAAATSCTDTRGLATGELGESPAEVPDTSATMLAALYQPILEPFTATFTYTRTPIDGDHEPASPEESYAAIQTTIVQDAQLDISVTGSGQWWDKSADHLFVDGELYVRNRELRDDVPADVAGIDAGQWVPYYDWVRLNLAATESLVLDAEEFAPGVDPERPFLARAPLSVMDGEQLYPPPRSCVDFQEGIPDNHITRIDEQRWSITCAVGLGALDTFIAEFDASGRLVRFHDGRDTATPEYEIVITYGHSTDVISPDTSWWRNNQPLVRERLERLAAVVYGDTAPPQTT